MNRRNILGAGTGGLALVLFGGVWRVTRTPETAYKPWNVNTLTQEDVRLDAFSHAILAPNPHNRQPWTIQLIGSNEAIVSCDLDRRLPVTDPYDRQITIGFGAFLEIARIAAAEHGIAVKAELFPEGESEPRLDIRPVAHLTFDKVEESSLDPLYDAIRFRRSNKQVYETSRPVEPKMLREIVAGGGFSSNEGTLVAKLQKQILGALNAEFASKDAYLESVELMRIGHHEVAASPDGISLVGPMIETGVVTGQVSRSKLADIGSSTYQFGLDQTNEIYASVPAVIWIKTPRNTRIDQIEAGRQYVRANLRSTQLGLAMHPMSQSLQEYSAVAQNARKVHELLGAKDEERIQMLARIGYAPKVGPSPRWPLDTRLRE